MLHTFGILLTALGLSMFPAIGAAIVYHESTPMRHFVATAIACMVAGMVITRFVTPSPEKAKTRDGFLIVSLCWILATFVGSVPMYLSGCFPTYIDAFFETCSGLTTTGASVIDDLESAPRSILLWRSITIWLGGAGIILFTTFLLPFSNMEGSRMSGRHATAGNIGNIGNTQAASIQYLFRVYLTLTATLTICLKIFGMSLYDALIHGLSVVATGGFSSYNDGIAHFSGNSCIIWTFVVFMVIAGCNFNLYGTILKKGIRKALNNTELKFYISIIAVATLLISADLFLKGGYISPLRSLRDAAFQVTSILSTTGQHTVNYNNWPTFAQMILLCLMLTGASSSSLGGGPKILRILVCLKMIRRVIVLKLHPNRVFTITLNRLEVPQETATNISNFMFLYIFTIACGSILIAFNGFDLMTTISSVISCVNNNGVGFNLVGPLHNFYAFSGFSKIVLSVLMIAGRLELFTFFMLFSVHYWNPNKA